MSATTSPFTTTALSTLRSTAEAAVQEQIRWAHASTTPLRLVGSGTWLHGGGPFAPAVSLDLRPLQGVVEYEPGDLVITVGAGTTLAELEAITSAHGQRFALEPYGDDASTIGAIVATASAAPLAPDALTVRDLVLGVRTISGTGEITQVGGRVVKNVAGFDLVRLHTGAWGTLGAITEVSLRLHAMQAHDAVWCGAMRRDLRDVVPALVANRAPLPMLLQLTPHQPPMLWARVSGNAARAESLRARVVQFGVGELHTATAHDLRTTHVHDVVLRARTALSDALPFVRAAQSALPYATLLFDPARGSLRVVIPGGGDATAPAVSQEELTRDLSTWRRLAAEEGARHQVSVVIDQGRTHTPERLPLDAGIKRAFDPHDLLNRYVTSA